MKTFTITIITFLYIIIIVETRIWTETDVETEWDAFKLKHEKNFTSSEEEQHRKKIFYENFVKVTEHNKLHQKGEESYAMAINRFSDLTEKEMARYMGLEDFQMTDRLQKINFDLNAEVPEEIDWRKLGAVTGVKWQDNCAACWAFGAIGALESQYFIKTGKLVRLSEQNLVDCATVTGNKGCTNGNPLKAYEYIYLNGGIDSEESYPYEAEQQNCAYEVSYNVTTIRYFGISQSGSEEDLKIAVGTVGPVAAGIYANADFQHYSGGVFYSKDCVPDNNKKKMNHVIVIVGYGTTEDGKEYWLAKNSWSEYWGESGYIRMARNKNNLCGIATDASFPLLY